MFVHLAQVLRSSALFGAKDSECCQLWKDMQRDRVRINGVELSGEVKHSGRLDRDLHDVSFRDHQGSRVSLSPTICRNFRAALAHVPKGLCFMCLHSSEKW